MERREDFEKIKRIICNFFTLSFLIGGVTQVSAVTYTANSKGKSFSKSWSVTQINTATRTFKYGFNTKFINEDYTHTFHANKKHTATVKNTGGYGKKTANAGKYAKIEIAHKGGNDTVYYTYSY